MKKLNKQFFLFIFVFAMPFVGISQINEKSNLCDSIENEIYNNHTKRNSVYFELLGNGLYYSFGYQRKIMQKNNYCLSIATGFSYFPKYDEYGLSPQLNFALGDIHKLELGLGYTLLFYYEENLGTVENPKYMYDHLIFGRIGYKYQKNEEKVFYKVAFTPFHFKDNWVFPFVMPWIGAAIGYTF